VPVTLSVSRLGSLSSTSPLTPLPSSAFDRPLPTASMVHTNLLSAVAARTHSSGSFHAGAPIPTLVSMESSRRLSVRRQSTPRYHTFPTPPPKTPRERSYDDTAVSSSSSSAGSDADEQTPLPVRQLCLLAFLSLAEQTALNSIAPYLPSMIRTFPEIPSSQTGLYVGILASAFALAQLSTNLLWGYLSDLVGRKPVMLLGTFLLMGCFAAFGFCTTYWEVVMVHVAMGMLNGNAAVVPTVLGECTDRSNQSVAFTWLPVIYSLGGITGPALGGLLVGTMGGDYPYLAPNILSAGLLLASVVVLGIWFEETLEGVEKWTTRLGLFNCFSSCCGGRRGKGSWIDRWPRRDSDEQRSRSSSTASSTSSSSGAPSAEGQGLLSGTHAPEPADDNKDAEGPTSWSDLINHTTFMLLGTYLIFQLSNVSFNSLYPIFASTPPPTGRDLSPGNIGLSLSLAGIATILFQIFLFQPLKARMGNLGTYRWALFGFAISMSLMPWVGYRDDEPPFGFGSGRGWLFSELGFVLIVKNICAVGGLSCVMLLVCLFSFPAINHERVS
jgi:MFS family permease